MAQIAQDDGFHEIQLNGKQLVFVFMAATVVSVVIFLCGVLVGRGVRVDRSAPEQIVEQTATDQLRSTIDDKPVTVPVAEDPTKALPPPPAEGGTATGTDTGKDDATASADSAKGTTAGAASAAALAAAAKMADKGAEKMASPAPAPVTTSGRADKTPDKPTAKPTDKPAAKPTDKPADKPTLVAAKAPVAPVAPAATTAAKGPEAAPKAVASPRASVTPDASSTTAAGVPAVDSPGQGWVVQVAATKTRSEADTIAKRLSSKGYATFISNSANVFRVRIGGYKSKKDADVVAARLKKDERVNPWVTR